MVVNDSENPDPLNQTYTVNGQANPVLTIRPGEWQVFNVGNIGNNAFYTLTVVDNFGHEVPLDAVAADGNPFTHVIQMSELETPPGRRWSFTFQPPTSVPAGQTVQWTIRSKGYLDGFLFWPPQVLATINYTGSAVSMAAPVTDGSLLTPPEQNFHDLAALPPDAIAQHRTVVFGEGFNAEGEFVTTINGGQFPDNVVFQPRIGTVEEWTLINMTTDDHPFHIHTNPFQVISITYPPGVPNPYPNGLPIFLDVVNVPRGGSVTIRMAFEDYIGTAVFHCHRVDHEDEGMMSAVTFLPQRSILAVGAGPGGGPQVNVYDETTHQLLTAFYAFDSKFTGGVNVAVGDVNGDGVSDVICGAGPGGGPQVTVFDGATNFQMIRSFYAFDPSFRGGVTVAAGDANSDGLDDIICGAGAGGGPQVTVYSGKDNAILLSFYAFDSKFTGGVSVAAADIDGNGRLEIICGAGLGGGPQVTVFDNHPHMLASFYAFDSKFTGGVFVSTGRVRQIGFPSILCAAGPGGGPQVAIFQSGDVHSAFNLTHGGHSSSEMTMTHTSETGHRQLDITEIGSFYAYSPSYRGGLRIGAINNAVGTDIMTGPGDSSEVRRFDGLTYLPKADFFAMSPTFHGGVTVAGN